MVKLVKIRYIGGKIPGFEHVMKEQLAQVLKARGQVEILPDEVPPEKPKSEKESEKEKSKK